MVILAEGMPRNSTKLIEKICCWEYVDLSKLLGGSDPVPDEASVDARNRYFLLHSTHVKTN